MSVSIGRALDQQPRTRDPAGELVVRVASAGWRFGDDLPRCWGRGVQTALVDQRLSTLPVHRGTFLALFVSEQSLDRRADGAFHCVDHLAAVEAQRAVEEHCASRAGTRDAVAEWGGRRQ